jgi:hypothetical protein
MASEQSGNETTAAPGETGYETRYGGWHRRNGRLIVIALVFCAAAFLPTVPVWFRVVDLVFFGGGALLLLAATAGRPVALRVNATGITLCRSPLYRRSTTQTYSWPDVELVVIWQAFNMDFVGVQRAPGAPPLSGRFIGRTSARTAARTSGLPPEVAVTGVPANNWVLDRRQLAAATTQFAPHVAVLDLTAPGQRRGA